MTTIIERMTLNKLIESNLLNRDRIKLYMTGFAMEFVRSADRQAYYTRGHNLLVEFGERIVKHIGICTEQMAEIVLEDVA